jgi:hypothetical protein|tara:strand:+ start:595 stop:1038 length:444 start_codon:yes stop_codon:yes gene_type:complete
MIDKKIFVGLALGGTPHLSITRRDKISIGYQVEAFYLIPCKSRTGFLLDFIEQQNLKATIWTLNGCEYLRIQHRDSLKSIFKMIPDYLVEADRRLCLFLDAMNIIKQKRHLTLEGFEEITKIKDKMTRDDKNGIDINQQRESHIISG